MGQERLRPLVKTGIPRWREVGWSKSSGVYDRLVPGGGKEAAWVLLVVLPPLRPNALPRPTTPAPPPPHSLWQALALLEGRRTHTGGSAMS